MTRRHPAIVLLLTLVTCSVYWFYWIYVTTDELKRRTNRQELNPAVDTLLCVLTCALWGIYVEYRNATIVHQTLLGQGVAHEDKAVLILVLNLASLMVGVTGLVAVVLLQDEYNKLAEPPPVAP